MRDRKAVRATEIKRVLLIEVENTKKGRFSKAVLV